MTDGTCLQPRVLTFVNVLHSCEVPRYIPHSEFRE